MKTYIVHIKIGYFLVNIHYILHTIAYSQGRAAVEIGKLLSFLIYTGIYSNGWKCVTRKIDVSL